MDNLINSTVYHKKYGRGIITDISSTHIKINFSDELKTFNYPYAFENFLTLENKEIQNTIIKQIKDKKQIDIEEKLKYSDNIAKELKKRNGRKLPVKKILDNEQIFYSHAAILNNCFGYSYSTYLSGLKHIDDNYSIWFPTIAEYSNNKSMPAKNSITWINIMKDNGNTIIETNTNANKIINKSMVNNHKNTYRFVFLKHNNEFYCFEGLYKLNKEKSNLFTYHYDKIGSVINLLDFSIIN